MAEKKRTAPSQNSQPRAPQIVGGRYKLEKKIGSGSFGLILSNSCKFIFNRNSTFR